MNPRPPLVPGVVAPLAPLAVVELVLPRLRQRQLQLHQQFVAGVELRPAFDADLPHQSLGQHRLHRRRDQEWRHPHVAQPRDRRRRVVRVQRAEHHVPRQGALDGDLGCLVVADLAHQDDVGVVPEDRPQHRRERHVDFRIHRDLDQPVDLVLHRVFGRDHLGGDLVHLVQDRVERRGLPRSRRPGHEDDPVRPVHHLAELRQRRRVHPNLVQVELHHRPVQHPHDHRLAKQRGQHADPQVDRVPPDRQLDPPVLGDPPLGDVEVRHDLHPAHDRVRQVPRGGNHLEQHPVGPHPNLELVFERFEVDVAGLILDRQQQHHVQQLADRGGVGHFLGTRQVVAPPLLVVILVDLEPGDHILDALLPVGVVPLNRRLHVRRAGHRPAHVVPQEVPEIVECRNVLRIGHRHRQHIVLERDRHDLVDAGHGLGNQLQHLRGNGRLFQVDDLHSPLLGQRLAQLRLGRQPHPDHDLPQQLARRFLLLLEHIPQLVFVEVPQVNQDLAQPSFRHVSPASSPSSLVHPPARPTPGRCRFAGGSAPRSSHEPLSPATHPSSRHHPVVDPAAPLIRPLRPPLPLRRRSPAWPS